MGKDRTKSAKTAISGIFPAFSAGKKLFLKIGLGDVLGIANTRLCAKNQVKLMMKSLKNAKKPVFPACFRHFRPEKYVFRKSGSVTFQTLAFCISVPNFMKKYTVQLEKFKKYRFSGKKLAVQAIFRKFRLQKSVLLTIKLWFMAGIVINNVFC